MRPASWRHASGPPRAEMLPLQQAAGNQALQRMLLSRQVQAKLTVNPPDDAYEHEADRVADAVTRPAPAAASTGAGETSTAPSPGEFGSIQREPEKKDDDHKPVQTMHLDRHLQREAQGDDDTAQTVLQREARDDDSTAQTVLQRDARDDDTAQTVLQRETRDDDTAQTRSAGGPGGRWTAGPEVEAMLEATAGGGQPMSESLREFFEPRFGHDLGSVRFHTGGSAAAAAQALRAKAFTRGQDVYFGAGYFQPATAEGQRLIAHELTHTLQQRTGPVRPSLRRIQARPLDADPLPSRGPAVGRSLARSPAPQAEALGRAPGSSIQRAEEPSTGEKLWAGIKSAGSTVVGGVKSAGSTVVDGVTSVADKGIEFLKGKAMERLGEHMPELAAILASKEGFWGWVKGKVLAAAGSLLDMAMAPVKKAREFVDGAVKQVKQLTQWMGDAVTQIAAGDCKPLVQAAQKIEQVFDRQVEGIAPLVTRVGDFAEKISGFFKGLWTNFALPAWDAIKKAAGKAWESVEFLAKNLWAKTEPVRALGGQVWGWVQERLGFSPGANGENGVLDWVKGKASEAWKWVSDKLEPLKKPALTALAAVAILTNPLSSFALAGTAVMGMMSGVRWIRRNLTRPDGVVKQRSELKGTVLPELLTAVSTVTGGLKDGAKWLTDNLKAASKSLGGVVGAVGGSVLSFALDGFTWIVDQFEAFVEWGTVKLQALVDKVGDGLEGLRKWLQPVMDVLRQVDAVVTDALKVVGLVLGSAWKSIPACIRDPFITFLFEHVLVHLPILKDIIGVPETWAKVKVKGLALLRQVFKDGDLRSAMRSIFDLVLIAFNVPTELIKTIYAKASKSFDQLLDHPLLFLKNLVGSVREGFVLFIGNFDRHLLGGLSGWLFGEVAKTNLQVPAAGDISFGSVFKLVLDILGINKATIFDRLRKKLPASQMRVLEVAGTMLDGAWTWVTILHKEGPAALGAHIKDQLGDLWKQVAGMVTGWLTENIIVSLTVKALTSLDPTGIMAAINTTLAAYRAIQTFVGRFREALTLMDSVLDGIADILSGALKPAGARLEKAMSQSMPLMIAFLANQAGLGDLGKKIKTIIEDIRKPIEKAIDKLIDKAKALGGKLLAAGKNAAGKVMAWWRVKRGFEGRDGKPHTLTIDRSASGALVAEVRSEVTQLTDAISKIKDKTKREKLLALYKQLEAEVTSKSSRNEHEKRHEKLRNQVEEIVKGLKDWGKVPPTVVSHQKMSDGRSFRVIADPLTSREGNTRGSASKKQFKPELDALIPKKQSRLIVSPHLLSALLHGPGEDWNLAAGSAGLNRRLKVGPETDAENMIRAGKSISYVATVKYHSGAVPTKLPGIKSALIGLADNEKIAKKVAFLMPIVAQSYTIEIGPGKIGDNNDIAHKKYKIEDEGSIPTIDGDGPIKYGTIGIKDGNIETIDLNILICNYIYNHLVFKKESPRFVLPSGREVVQIRVDDIHVTKATKDINDALNQPVMGEILGKHTVDGAKQGKFYVRDFAKLKQLAKLYRKR